MTSGDAVTMKVSGVSTEEVSVTLYDMSSKKTVVIVCTISDSGINQLTVGHSELVDARVTVLPPSATLAVWLMVEAHCHAKESN